MVIFTIGYSSILETEREIIGMSKSMTSEQLTEHLENATKALNKLLFDWSELGEGFKKRAQLLAYWVSGYVYYLRRESTFNPKEVPKLKRGSVVSVDFGFRIGNELGGRHFAVVLDNHNDLSSGIVTVVPLGSLKSTYRDNKYTCALEDGIYAPVNNRCFELIADLSRLRQIIDCGVTEDNLKSYEDTLNELSNKLKIAQTMLNDLEHMKTGSVANVCQVTTVSKIRIKRPLSKTDPLYGIRLTERDMESINKRVSDLYVFHKNID